jgi:hypothetical protein
MSCPICELHQMRHNDTTLAPEYMELYHRKHEMWNVGIDDQEGHLVVSTSTGEHMFP